MRFLLWLLVFVGLLYGGYVAYDYWFDGDEVIVRKTPGDVFAFLKEKTGREIEVLREEYINEPAKKAIAEKKEELSDSARELTAQAVAGLGDSLKNISLEISGKDKEEAYLMSKNDSATKASVSRVVINKGESLKIRLSTQEERLVYTVEWGDGVRDVVTLLFSESAEVSHEYKSVGDYNVLVISSVDGRTSNSLIGVSVIDK